MIRRAAAVLPLMFLIACGDATVAVDEDTATAQADAAIDTGGPDVRPEDTATDGATDTAPDTDTPDTHVDTAVADDPDSDGVTDEVIAAVTQAHRDLLGREPTDEEVAAWVDLILDGTYAGLKRDADYIVDEEHRSVTLDRWTKHFIATAVANGETLTPTGLIYKIYWELLDREPDPDGLAYWLTEREANAWTEAELRQAILEAVCSDQPDHPLCPSMFVVSQDYFDQGNLAMGIAAQRLHDQGRINLVGFDITARDLDNTASRIFAEQLRTVPPTVNQATDLVARADHVGSRYPDIVNHSDGVFDSERPDSTDMLTEALSRGPITYVVGGHITNLQYCLMDEACNALAQTNLHEVIFITDPNNRTDGTNCCRESGAVAATQYVMGHLPPNTDFYTAWIWSDPPAVEKSALTSELTPMLAYVEQNGPYDWYRCGHCRMHFDDVEALAYAVDRTVATRHQTCFTVGSDGRFQTNPGTCNHYYLSDYDLATIERDFVSLIKA